MIVKCLGDSSASLWLTSHVSVTEFDLDTLTDLIDEDDFGTEVCWSDSSAATTLPQDKDDVKNTSVSDVVKNKKMDVALIASSSLTPAKSSDATKESTSAFIGHQKVAQTKSDQVISDVNSNNNIKGLKDIEADIFKVESSNVPDVTEKGKTRSLAEEMAETALGKRVNSVVHTGETDSSDEESKDCLTETGRMIKKRIAHKTDYNSPQPKALKTWKSQLKQNSITKHLEVTKDKQESFVADRFSGIRIVNPLVSLTHFESKMNGRRMIKMSFIRNFMKKGDIEGDWVTMGVLVSKLPPKTSKNGKTYSIWKMTDLIEPAKIVTIFLFGAVHAEHWKTTIGTVVGILNPSFMPEREGYKSDGITLSVDHPGKFMMMGTSKDFGHCKANRKDGTSCSSVINKTQGEYCVYHIQKEYKKMSSKRSDIQSSYSGGKGPNLKNKILKGTSVMYGGQLFSQPVPQKKSASQVNAKDKLTLNNLTLKRKAEVVEQEAEEKAKTQKKLTDVYDVESASAIKTSSQSQFINQQLSIPSAGSRNLIRHFMQDQKHEETKKKDFKSVTPKELLKMHEQELRERRLKMQSQNATGSPAMKNVPPQIERSPSVKNTPPQIERTSGLKNTSPQMERTSSLKNMSPQIGRGLQPGQDISFDISTPSRFQSYTSKDVAKLKAIESIKQRGPIQPKDPNAVKSVKSAETLNRIKMSLEKSAYEAANTSTAKPEEKSNRKPEDKTNTMQTGILGSIDMNSERIKKFLNRKSTHAHEVEMDEVEKQEKYFSRLEKKEQMEEKMASTTEIVCKVVSCKECKYTAEKVQDFCKDNDHPLRWHKAVKRFFECTVCKRHTSSFNKYPTKACSFCQSSTFVRSGMMKQRIAMKAPEEQLVLRGGDVENLNSVSTKTF